MPYLKYLEKFQVKDFGLFKALGSCPEAIGHILIYITSGSKISPFEPYLSCSLVHRSRKVLWLVHI